MLTSFSRVQTLETMTHCKQCNTPLLIERTCQDVYLYCSSCKKAFSIAEYISQADDIIINFLNNLDCDRI